MSGNLDGFDPNEVEESKGFDLLPNGDYRVILVESAIVPYSSNSASQSEQLKCTFQCLDRPFINRKLWFDQNTQKRDGSKNKVGWGYVKALMKACGKLQAKDTSELHNIPLGVRVRQEDNTYEKDGEKRTVRKNKIVKFFPAKKLKSESQSQSNQQPLQENYQPTSNTQAPQQYATASAAFSNDPDIPF